MLLKNDTTIVRVLKTQEERFLVIDCIKRTMPKWMDSTSLSGFTECNEADLYAQTGMIQDRELTPDEQRIAQERYLEEINKRNISYSQNFYMDIIRKS